MLVVTVTVKREKQEPARKKRARQRPLFAPSSVRFNQIFRERQDIYNVQCRKYSYRARGGSLLLRFAQPFRYKQQKKVQKGEKEDESGRKQGREPNMRFCKKLHWKGATSSATFLGWKQFLKIALNSPKMSSRSASFCVSKNFGNNFLILNGCCFFSK